MKPSPFGLTRLSPKQIHYCACGKATKTNKPIKVKYGSTPPCLTQALQCLNLLVWENFSKAMRANSMTVGWASELWETKRTNKDKDKDKKNVISELKVTLRCGASPKICLKVSRSGSGGCPVMRHRETDTMAPVPDCKPAVRPGATRLD